MRFQIALKIQEILETGHLKKLDDTKDDENIRALEQLTSIHGLGLVTAKFEFPQILLYSVSQTFFSES